MTVKIRKKIFENHIGIKMRKCYHLCMLVSLDYTMITGKNNGERDVAMKEERKRNMKRLAAFILSLLMFFTAIPLNNVMASGGVGEGTDGVEGVLIPQFRMKVEAVSSQETTDASFGANVLDGKDSTIWHSQWSGVVPAPPHWIVVDLGDTMTVQKLFYLPRQDNDNGTITNYRVSVSMDGRDFEKVDEGVWNKDKTEKTASFPAVEARYIKLEGFDTFTSCAELNVETTDVEQADLWNAIQEYNQQRKAAEKIFAELELRPLFYSEESVERLRTAYEAAGEIDVSQADAGTIKQIVKSLTEANASLEETGMTKSAFTTTYARNYDGMTEGTEIKLERNGDVVGGFDKGEGLIYKGIHFGEAGAAKLRVRGANGYTSDMENSTAKLRFWFGEGETDFVEIQVEPTGGWEAQHDRDIDLVLPEDIGLTGVKDIRLELMEGAIALHSFVFLEKETAQVSKITLNSTEQELQVDGVFQLEAAVEPENAEKKEITWSTSDENIAAVSDAGLVTAKAVGMADITASVENGVSASCKVTVKPKAEPGDVKIPQSIMSVKAVSSEEDSDGSYGANVLDGDKNTIWHSKWSGAAPQPPHWITLDLGRVLPVKKLHYLPRPESHNNGTITSYTISTSLDGVEFTTVNKGVWEKNNDEKTAAFLETQARYIKLEGYESFASCAEINIETSDITHKNLWDTLTKGQMLLRNAVVGSGRGQYTEESVRVFRQAVEEARATAANISTTQVESQRAAEALKEALGVFKSAQVPYLSPYEQMEPETVDAEDIKGIDGGTYEIKQDYVAEITDRVEITFSDMDFEELGSYMLTLGGRCLSDEKVTGQIRYKDARGTDQSLPFVFKAKEGERYEVGAESFFSQNILAIGIRDVQNLVIAFDGGTRFDFESLIFTKAPDYLQGYFEKLEEAEEILNQLEVRPLLYTEESVKVLKEAYETARTIDLSDSSAIRTAYETLGAAIDNLDATGKAKSAFTITYARNYDEVAVGGVILERTEDQVVGGFTEGEALVFKGLDFGTKQPLKLRLRGANGNPGTGNTANAKVRFWYGEGENEYIDTVLRKTGGWDAMHDRDVDVTIPEDAGLTGVRDVRVELIEGGFAFHSFTFLDESGAPNLWDIPYVENSDNSEQMLDIIVPEYAQGQYPAIVFIHGGAWVQGDKAEGGFYSGPDDALKNGYVVVNVNYRLAQNAKWPAQIYDCKAAIRYIRANADKYHIDPDRIAVWGASAGGHLAQMLATTNGNPEMEDLSMGNGEVSSDIQAAISYFGISDVSKWDTDTEALRGLTPTGKTPTELLLGDNYTVEDALAASPISYVSESTVPILITHGGRDDLVPDEQTKMLEEELRKYLKPEMIDTYYPAEAGHNDAFWGQPEPEKKPFDFLFKHLKPTELIDAEDNVYPGGTVTLDKYTNKYTNVAYAGQSPIQKLHLVFPEKKEEKNYPLIIFIHGGGFAAGNSSDAGLIFTAQGPLHALEKGYAVALVDYRYAWDYYFPTPVHDIKAAIRYLRANADEYGLDENRFAIWGESAGGHLANYVALTGGRTEFEDLSMGNAEYSSEVQAVISHYAITDMTTDRNAQYRPALLGGAQNDAEAQRKASPLYQVTKDAPPTYLQHGMADDGVDYHDSIALYEKLVEVTGDSRNKLDLFPGYNHAVKKFFSEENAGKLIAWLDEILVEIPVEKEALENAISDAKKYQEKEYTAESWKKFEKALEKAQIVYDKEDAKQNKVDEALQYLLEAIDGLEKPAGKPVITVTAKASKQVLVWDEVAQISEVKAVDLNGQEVDLSEAEITYTSTDTNVISVDTNGQVAAKNAGMAKVQVKVYLNGQEIVCELSFSVSEVTPVKPFVSSKTQNSVTLKAVPGYEYAVEVPGKALEFKNTVVFTGLKVDTEYKFYQRIGATGSHRAGTKTAELLVRTDKEAPISHEVKNPASVKLNVKSGIALGKKEKLQLKATVLPRQASQKVTWKTSKKSVVSITSKGKITAKKAGKARITAVAANGKKAVITVTVKNAPKKISPAVKNKTLKRGKSFKVKVKFPAKTACYQLKFKSNKKSVATVSATGIVKARKRGKANITITAFNGKKARVKITVR